MPVLSRLMHPHYSCGRMLFQADKVDAYLHTVALQSDNGRSHLACLGTWVLLHTLRTMIQYLLSGFELTLYSVYEYHYIFW